MRLHKMGWKLKRRNESEMSEEKACYYNENEIQNEVVPATLQHTHMDLV